MLRHWCLGGAEVYRSLSPTRRAVRLKAGLATARHRRFESR
jgi:hypothetical protein